MSATEKCGSGSDSSKPAKPGSSNPAPPRRSVPRPEYPVRAGKRLPLGFKPENEKTRQIVRVYSRRSPAQMLMWACAYWANIALAITANELLMQHLYTALSLVAYLACILWIARSMRALECMTHEFGHGVFRKRRFIDNIVGNLLVALPVVSTVAGMRNSHNNPHHAMLGITGADPDLRRYDDLGAHDIDRSNVMTFASEVLARLPRYVGSWFKLMSAQSTTVAAAAAWHACVLAMFVTTSFADPVTAIWKWFVYWLIPYTTVLPIIRFIGETGKHVYSAGSTVMDVTVSNLGTIHELLIHPFGDGHHSLHHLFAHVPGYHLARLHKWLMANEPGYRRALRYRLRILERPRQMM